MSLALDILEELWNINLKYKGVNVNIFGVPRFKKSNVGSVRSALSRLNSKKLVVKDGSSWYVTDDGKNYLESKQKLLEDFNSPFTKNAPKNLIVMFDVPESKSNERFWLRKHLKKFGYTMIQKSVWVGPSPLPKDFSSYIKRIELDKCIKKFRLANKV